MTALMTPNFLAPGPAAADIEVYVSQCRNVAPPNSSDPALPNDEYTAATILVSLSASATDRLALWPLRHALSFAQCSVICGAEWPKRLAEQLAAVEPQFATAVVFVGSNVDLVVETVQAAIDVLYRQFGSTLTAVVVVPATTERFALLRGVTGFVRGVAVTSGDTARQVFLVLSSLIAPEALGGIDLIDLLPALGTAIAPSVMAQGLWFREGDGSLVYSAVADKNAVAHACHVVAVPFIRGSDWSELRRFHRALREGATACRLPIVFATNNALVPGLLPSNVGWVPILCANFR
jgi:hypothetical protein